MAKAVDDGFDVFLTKLAHSSAETEAAKKHRASIKACLEANFGTVRFFRSGSYGNGTSVSGHSDIDFFAVISPNKLKANSTISLSDVKDALAKRFPNTGVRVSCPAVKVPFSNDTETSEVVPGYYFTKSKQGDEVFKIADCAGGWMQTSPTAHNDYVATVNKSLGNKVKPVVRFIKAWKFYNNVQISSFYLEMRVAKYATGEKTILYPYDVAGVLNHLQSIKLADMQDPMGISGYIVPTRSESKLKDALSKLDSAATRANKAIAANSAGNIKEAFGWWDLVFGGQFPAYY